MLHTHLSQSLRCATGLSASTLSHSWHLVRHTTAAKPTLCYNILSVLNFKKCEKHTFGMHTVSCCNSTSLFLHSYHSAVCCGPAKIYSGDRQCGRNDKQHKASLPCNGRINRSLERKTYGILISDTLNHAFNK